MKKAFDENVSRAKPRLRLGAFTKPLPEALPASEPVAEPQQSPDLSSEVKARAERSREPKVAVNAAMQRALEPEVPVARAPIPPSENGPAHHGLEPAADGSSARRPR